MLCPTDGSTLLLSERQGIEIDYCPKCRGVWLDRGELDKLIERGDRDDDDDDRRRDFDRRDDDRRREFDRRDDDRWQDRDRDRDYAPSQYRPKRKKGFLSEMFEFGD
jgi:Zn-finger nucleic acid-binding protein